MYVREFNPQRMRLWPAKVTIFLLFKDTKMPAVTSRVETSKLGIACLSGGQFLGEPVTQGAFVCSLLVTRFVFGQSVRQRFGKWRILFDSCGVF